MPKLILISMSMDSIVKLSACKVLSLFWSVCEVLGLHTNRDFQRGSMILQIHGCSRFFHFRLLNFVVDVGKLGRFNFSQGKSDHFAVTSFCHFGMGTTITLLKPTSNTSLIKSTFLRQSVNAVNNTSDLEVLILLNDTSSDSIPAWKELLNKTEGSCVSGWLVFGAFDNQNLSPKWTTTLEDKMKHLQPGLIILSNALKQPHEQNASTKSIKVIFRIQKVIVIHASSKVCKY